jgi:hypothetical protein
MIAIIPRTGAGFTEESDLHARMPAQNQKGTWLQKKNVHSGVLP